MRHLPPGRFLLYAISSVGPDGDIDEFLSTSSRLAEAGLDLLQLREKSWDDRRVIDVARELRHRLSPGCQILINRRYDLALAAGVDGVHLPEDGLPCAEVRRRTPENFLILRSTHDPGQLELAAELDAATFGPVFDTPSKRKFGAPAGLDRLTAACQRSPAPVLALGGVSLAEIGPCRQAGAAGVAAIRLFFDAPDPAAVVRMAREAAESSR